MYIAMCPIAGYAPDGVVGSAMSKIAFGLLIG